MKMSEQYCEWRSVMESTFPWIADIVETLLSVVVLLWFDNVRLPFALVLVGRPAGWKTTALKCIDERMLDFVYYTDSFTPKAFVSHMIDKNEKKLKKIDLLPRIKDKVFVVPELAPIFTQERDRLMQSIGVLTRVLDGQGYISDSGAQGRRGYQGAYKFMWLAATTPIPYRVWDVMATLGTKMYFLHVPEVKWSEKQQIEWFLEDTYENRLNRASQATADFLTYLKSKTPIKWNKKNDDLNVLRFIRKLALLLARLRGKVNVATKTVFYEDGREHVVVHTTPVIEDPMRAFIMLHTLASGHAFVRGRRQINFDDVPYIIEVALCGAPRDHVEAFKALLREGGVLTTSRLVELTNCSRHTAVRALETLSILKLVKPLGEIIRGRLITAEISDDLSWCLENEYLEKWRAKKKLRKPVKRGSMHESSDGKQTVLIENG